ncbi:MAG: DUF3667 domain-containing protein [Bacteroidota bacterium]
MNADVNDSSKMTEMERANAPGVFEREYRFGQTEETRAGRVSFNGLVGELVGTFRHHFQVFWATTFALFASPGKVLNTYLNGYRGQYYNPVNYFFLIASVTTFINLLVIDTDGFNRGVKDGSKNDEFAQFMGKLLEGYFEYMNISMFTLVFFLAYFSYRAFKSKGILLGEHLIVMLYVQGAVGLVSLPFYGFVALDQTRWMFTFFSYSTLVWVLYLIWVYRDLFKISWGKAVWKSVVVNLLALFVFYFIILLLALIIITIYLIWSKKMTP